MSSGNNALNQSNQSITNYTTEKLLLGNNRYVEAVYSNDTYNDVTLDIGTLMGRIASTDYISNCVSGNADGTQYPLGVVVDTVTVPAGELKTITLCNGGKVRKERDRDWETQFEI